jgi:glycosyltransferase involved in cell wall biosynthesis
MESTAPSVSVVIPLYNGAETIQRALDSVLAQTVSDFEVIVVDDGSADSGPETVRAIEDPRVRLIQQENRGVSVARNAGVASARAPWVAFLDHDDEWKPKFLATVLRLAEAYPECRVAATSYEYHRSDGSISRPALQGFHGIEGLLDPYFSIAARSMPPICSSAVMVAKDELDDIGGFPEGIATGEDLLTWARLACRYPIAYSAESLAVYWIRQFEDGRFKRNMDTADPVGISLRALFNDAPRPQGWRPYLARWYRIRAWQWLQVGNPREAIGASLRSLWYNPRAVRVWGYMAMALLPSVLRNTLLRSPE